MVLFNILVSEVESLENTSKISQVCLMTIKTQTAEKYITNQIKRHKFNAIAGKIVERWILSIVCEIAHYTCFKLLNN